MNENKLEQHLFDEMRIIQKQLLTVQIQLAELRIKSGVWGLLGASIPVCIMFAVQYFKN